MGLPIKRIIIISVTLVLTAIFLGLKTETRMEIVAPMAWDVHTLTLYGVRIMGGGGFFHPVIDLATIGHYKYWICAMTLLTGVVLCLAAGRKTLAEIFNISYHVFLALAVLFMLFNCAAIVFYKNWNSLPWELFFLDGYIPIAIAFLPAVIFKVLSGYCRHKAAPFNLRG